MNNITDFEMVNGVLKKYKGTDPNVIIPNGVAEIGEIAFYNCKSLVSVTIPKGITKIGYGAFCKCESLENIIIPNSVIIIGENAFYNCKSLASATIPNSVTKIGVHAFKDCTSLTINCEAEKKPDGWSKYWNPDNHHVNWGYNPTKIASDFEIVNGVLIEYKGADPNVIIPEGVTSIGEHAFFNCSSLTSVTIPTGVTTIEKSAFWGCSSLTSAIIPEGATKIGERAFWGCSSLASITIPKGVIKIGDSAFDCCESLVSVTIPNSVDTIGDNAFHRCTSLEKLTVDPSNPSYKSIDGNLYSKDGKALIQYAVGKKEKAFVIPNSVTSIGSRAFENCPSLVGITIPDSVRAIGESAFAFCYSLADIKIPSSVIAIGAHAFSCCMSLEITCEAKKALDSWSEKWNSNNRPVNWRCTQKKHLSNFEITNGVLIKYNGTEPNVILPNGITRIGSNAFSSCVFLESVTIPNGVIAIGEYAFSHCKFLKNINLPNSVIAIGMHAFFECEILESITIPNTTISLGEGAFDRCSKLTIHCEAPFKPKSWHKDWNISKCPVVWGYKLK